MKTNEMYDYPDEELELEMPTKDMSRAKRRKQDFSKAMRKAKLDHKIRPGWPSWYGNLHQYSKNKIHCSCWMCTYSKTFDLPRVKDIKERDIFRDSVSDYEAS